jgi:putative sterol carrier protein
MPVFATREDAEATFGALFGELWKDAEVQNGLREARLSVLFTHTGPDVCVYMSADEIDVNAGPGRHASHTFRMSSDTAHAIWSGHVPFASAVTSGKLRIFGKVAKVLELMPILQPAFDIYPKVVAKRETGG